ncbi:ORF2 [Grizzly bear anellovirus 1]|nr:ORF2 [Grizzly bear anellovirus 1]
MRAQDRWRMQYKKQEAQWKRVVSESHKIWCTCPDYLNHFTCHTTGGGDGRIGADISVAEGISFDTDTHSTDDGEEDFTIIKETHR